MKRTAITLGVAAVALWSAGVLAQGRSFAGTWTIDSERMAAAAGSGGAVAVARSGGGGGARSGGDAVVGGAVMRMAGDVTAAGGAGGGRGRGGGMAAGPLSITMDATTFTVGTTAYRLDGSATTTETPRGTSTAKAAWKADKLVIETTNQGPNGPIVTTATWYLDGDALVREQSTPAPDGGDPRVSKVYYKKG